MMCINAVIICTFGATDPSEVTVRLSEEVRLPSEDTSFLSEVPEEVDEELMEEVPELVDEEGEEEERFSAIKVFSTTFVSFV